MELGLVLVLLLVLAAEFVNGWTDAPNAIATVVGTRSLLPIQAVCMAAVFNLLGVLAGTKVAETIGQGIVDANVVDLTTVGAAMVSIVLWSTLAARLGIPTSETHALVAGLAGGAFAAAGPGALVWSGWEKVLAGLVLSTLLGGLAGLLLMSAVYWLCRNLKPARTQRTFRVLQILSSALMAFSHGSNDGQKFMGAFTLALFIAGVVPTFAIPLWVILACACVLAVGTMTGGWRIIRTMGMKLTKLEAHQGFAAEVAAAMTIGLATTFGIPLSTTHTLTSSIVGVGATKGAGQVHWNVTRQLVLAWVLTFPICAAISYGVVVGLKWLRQ